MKMQVFWIMTPYQSIHSVSHTRTRNWDLQICNTVHFPTSIRESKWLRNVRKKFRFLNTNSTFNWRIFTTRSSIRFILDIIWQWWWPWIMQYSATKQHSTVMNFMKFINLDICFHCLVMTESLYRAYTFVNTKITVVEGRSSKWLYNEGLLSASKLLFSDVRWLSRK